LLHPVPSYRQAVALAALAAAAVLAVAGHVRARLAVHWLVTSAVALGAPVVVSAMIVLQSRSRPFPDRAGPVAAALLALAGLAVASATLAAVPSRRRLVALLLPLALAAVGTQVAAALPADVRSDLWRLVGSPWPNDTGIDLLDGGPFET
jgi:hypothetical protein